jgi:NUDIX domain
MGIHRETSGAILIDSFGRLLFQQRDNNPEILYPGMIGLFGGHREGEETFLDCVVREIHEEISYFVPAERFVHLVSYKGMARGGTFHSEALDRIEWCAQVMPKPLTKGFNGLQLVWNCLGCIDDPVDESSEIDTSRSHAG